MRRKLSLSEYAMWLLGAREYSVSRLREKCQERYPDQLKAIEVLIEDYKAKGYLNDERFCEVMIRSELRKGNGRLKIQQKLVQKGIAPELAKQQCAALIAGEDLLEPARVLAEKKRQQIERKYPALSDYEKNAKLMQYLAGRGYDYAVIQEVV